MRPDRDLREAPRTQLKRNNKARLLIADVDCALRVNQSAAGCEVITWDPKPS